MQQVGQGTMSQAVQGGLLGGLAQTAFVYGFSALIGLQLGDTVRFLGSLIGTQRGTIIGAAAAIFAVMALLWALLYVRITNTASGVGWKRGALYGAAIWLVSTLIIWPLLNAVHPAPVSDPGLLALGFGGFAALLTSLGAHLVYGIVLGQTVQTHGQARSEAES